MPRTQPLADGVVFQYKPAEANKPRMIQFRGAHQVDVHDDGTVTLRLAT